MQVLEWRQALPHANASLSECLFARRSNPLPLTCLHIASSSLCHFLGRLVGRAAGIAQNFHNLSLFQCADCGCKFQPWPMSLDFHFPLLAERQFTPDRLSLQRPSKAVDGTAISATAAKSQSQKLTFPPPPIPQTLFLTCTERKIAPQKSADGRTWLNCGYKVSVEVSSECEPGRCQLAFHPPKGYPFR